MHAVDARDVEALVDLDAGAQHLAAQPADVEPAGIPRIDAAGDVAEEDVVEIDAAEAILHPEDEVVVDRRPGRVQRGGVDCATAMSRTAAPRV